MQPGTPHTTPLTHPPTYVNVAETARSDLPAQAVFALRGGPGDGSRPERPPESPGTLFADALIPFEGKDAPNPRTAILISILARWDMDQRHRVHQVRWPRAMHRVRRDPINSALVLRHEGREWESRSSGPACTFGRCPLPWFLSVEDPANRSGTQRMLPGR